MTRFAIVIALMSLGACFKSHPEGQLELAGQDCYTCHTSDYQATMVPRHAAAPQTFSTTCANCHRMTNWQPALEGAHSEVFGIAQGPHTKLACLDCHDLASAKPSKLGANTNCLGCHPNDAMLTSQHDGVTEFDDKPYTYDAAVPNFCLECHPTGLAEKHPDDDFARKANHAVPCGDCHNRAAGPDTKGANVTCIDARCHHTVKATDNTDGHKDGDYQKARGRGTDPTFCHKCH